ncbi:hypothetical protein AV549_04790 [Salmonella enterica]|nr:hypothetical protein [Salmonella enterica]
MIKAGNGTMKTRDDRPSSALSRRLNLPALLWWLLMVCVLAGPGHAYAADSYTMCTTTSGSGTVNLQIPSSVSFAPEVSPMPGQLLYTSRDYKIFYKCYVNSGGPLKPALVRLGDMAPLGTALKAAGLKLSINITDSSGGDTVDWDPINDTAGYVELGNVYHVTEEPECATCPGKAETGDRTLTIRLKLSLEKKPVVGFYVVPSLSSFKIIATKKSFSSPGIQINTTPMRIQYVPNCFVQAGLSTGTVDFGPVITSDVDNNFSLPRTFSIQARANSDPACGKNQLTGPYEGAGNYYLQLPLKVAFLINSGGTPSSDNKAIILKNENDENNGLQLKISDPKGQFVTFNNESESLPKDSPANILGEFHDGIFTVNKLYTATLSQAPGKPVKTGKYRAQVTVKVSYY